MATNRAQNRVGLTSENDTGLIAPEGTELNPPAGTPLTSKGRTARRYKKRARMCACGCGKTVTPTARNPNKRFYDDACRKRWHRQQEAKLRANLPKAEPILELTICQFCGGSFLAQKGRGAKYCTPSHQTQAAVQRREAAKRVYIDDYHMTLEATEDMFESVTMKEISRHLRQNGYDYDERARRWGYKLHLVKAN